MTFDQLNIMEPILRALAKEGYSVPTPIQAQAIPPLLEGRDLQGCAQTGTGKTAAFAIPILQNLSRENRGNKGPRLVKSLILAPTRELAIQIGDSFTSYGRHTGLRNTVIFGGVSQKSQTDALRAGVDILVATPGRLLDLMQQRFIDLKDVSMFVLDEADRMLDMGMGHDVKRIIAKLPAKRQTMLFSATIPPEITKLMDSILKNPVKVAVTPVSSTIDVIEQSIYMVEKRSKKSLLIDLLKDSDADSVLVFSRTKHGANKITGELLKSGIEAQAIHGNKSQTARQIALNNFKEKKIRVLVATDIAARGIDVDRLSLVVNFDLPEVPETYVHRIGRTGRAGAEGMAISFCDEDERDSLRNIQKVIAKSIPVVHDHPYLSASPGVSVAAKPAAKSTPGGGAGRKPSGGFRSRNRQPSKRPAGK